MSTSFIKKFFSVALITIFFAPIFCKNVLADVVITSSPDLAPQTAGILVATKVTAGLNSVTTTWETIKKNGLDFLVYQASQLLMNQITDNIVTWIRGGFNGSPTFAVDPQRFFNDLADVIAGDLANQIRGLAVCDFDANFRISLMNSLFLAQDSDEKFARKVTCPFNFTDYGSCDSNGQNCRTLSPAEQAQAFSQSFVNGKWNAFEASLRDTGNTFGVALVTQKELERRTIAHQKIQEQKLTQSGGFLDILDTQNCHYPDGIDITNKSGNERQIYQRMYCTTTTPGSLVSDQLKKVTGLDLDRLGFADNFNKIASAFIQQVTKMAIQGVYHPQTDTGSGLAQRSRTDSFYQDCINRSAAATSTPEEDADIAAAVSASPTIINATEAYNTANTNWENANNTLADLRVALGAATSTFNAKVAEINSSLQPAYASAVGAYNTCFGNYNVNNRSAESINRYYCRAQVNARDAAFTNLTVAQGLIAGPTSSLPTGGALYAAVRAAETPIPGAVDAERRASLARDSANDLLSQRTNTAYGNARLSVLGVTMAQTGNSCLEQGVTDTVNTIDIQTGETNLDNLLRDAREQEPGAIVS